jgi:peptide-methionine (S)-S-oxide reductase
LGWFWHPQEKFGDIDGVLDTVVGYTGGTTKFPTYESLGDHTEALKIYFDPA